MCIFQFSYTSVYGSEDIKISSGTSFIDSNGKLNIIGVVTNYGVTSERVVVGLDIHNKIDDSNISLNDSTFSKIIYPGKESPFKFKISTDYDVLGKPHIIQIKKLNDPFYNVIIQNYSNFPVEDHQAVIFTRAGVDDTYRAALQKK